VLGLEEFGFRTSVSFLNKPSTMPLLKSIFKNFKYIKDTLIHKTHGMFSVNLQRMCSLVSSIFLDNVRSVSYMMGNVEMFQRFYQF
jgi:hypothetical protein